MSFRKELEDAKRIAEEERYQREVLPRILAGQEDEKRRETESRERKRLEGLRRAQIEPLVKPVKKMADPLIRELAIATWSSGFKFNFVICSDIAYSKGELAQWEISKGYKYVPYFSGDNKYIATKGEPDKVESYRVWLKEVDGRVTFEGGRGGQQERTDDATSVDLKALLIQMYLKGPSVWNKPVYEAGRPGI